MSAYQSESLNVIRSRSGCPRAVIFVHGFAGDRDDTWDRLPGLLGTVVSDWDIYTLGYATTFGPDFLGVWTGDPELPILATMLKTQAGIDPLGRYQSLALVAHSMGGLVVQRALIDDPALACRTKKVVLFGTPSAGLRKASRVAFWKRQLKNMATGSEFMTSLRGDWDERFGPEPDFDLRVVAGEQDQFVPPKSSLSPFHPRFHSVVAGDHRSMVRPASAGAPSVRLLTSVLSDNPVADEANAPLALAAQIPNAGASALIYARGDEMSEQDVVRAALALERNNKRYESIVLLQHYQALGTDVQGTLAGRIKRIWLENEDIGFAKYALDLYRQALDAARMSGDRNQIYYHSINIAFLEFVAFDHVKIAREAAELALANASPLSDKHLEHCDASRGATLLGPPRSRPRPVSSNARVRS